MNAPGMQLQILLPSRVFAVHRNVSRVVAETAQGFFGILPRRLDGVATLVPGILVFTPEEGGERYVAVDEGVLVKAGYDLTVAVRNAIGGDDLGKLREAVEHEFLSVSERERSVRSILAKLETNFVRRMKELHHE